jgi:hypothetical protein
METDISIWRKPGHFYFALTERTWGGAGETKEMGKKSFAPAGDLASRPRSKWSRRLET